MTDNYVFIFFSRFLGVLSDFILSFLRKRPLKVCISLEYGRSIYSVNGVIYFEKTMLNVQLDPGHDFAAGTSNPSRELTHRASFRDLLVFSSNLTENTVK